MGKGGNVTVSGWVGIKVLLSGYEGSDRWTCAVNGASVGWRGVFGTSGWIGWDGKSMRM